MNTMEVPPAASSFMTPRSSSVSCGVSTAVGSSRMSRSTLRESALRISTRCWVPTGRSSISASGSTLRLCLAESSLTMVRALSRSRIPPRTVSWPSIMFSATVMTGTSWKCWWTMPMPRRIASLGSLIRLESPLMVIVPASGVMSPKICLTRVDLPAPFSPRRATISPRSTRSEMSWLAWTVPKDFDRPSISSSVSRDPEASSGPGNAVRSCQSPFTNGCPTAPGALTRPAAAASTTRVRT